MVLHRFANCFRHEKECGAFTNFLNDSSCSQSCMPTRSRRIRIILKSVWNDRCVVGVKEEPRDPR